MLNMEGLSAEAKIGKILILVAVILGILTLIILGIVAAFVWSIGQVTGFGIFIILPQWILVAVLTLKLVGTAMGITALYYAGKDDFSRAGIFAVVSCVLPPLDLIVLIGGIFCLISREANSARTPPPSKTHEI